MASGASGTNSATDEVDEVDQRARGVEMTAVHSPGGSSHRFPRHGGPALCGKLNGGEMKSLDLLRRARPPAAVTENQEKGVINVSCSTPLEPFSPIPSTIIHTNNLTSERSMVEIGEM